MIPTATFSAIDAEQLGQAIITMSGGRKITTDQIDASVGFEMLVRIGDRVYVGQPLMNLFAYDSNRDEVTRTLRDAVTVADEPVAALPLVVDVI